MTLLTKVDPAALALLAGITTACALSGSTTADETDSAVSPEVARALRQLATNPVDSIHPAAGGVAGALPCEYALDDDIGENGTGLVAGGTLVWANAFQAQEGCEEIGTVRVAWFSGAFTPGLQAKVFVYDDPDNDGNPDDAVLLAITDVAVANEDTDIYNDYPIGPVTVQGDFFVGASIIHPPNQFPARFDETPPSLMQSWLALNPTDADDPLGSTTPLLSDDVGSGGNYMVRAVGLPPGDTCPSDVDDTCTTDVDDLITVILDWGCGEAGPAGDCTGDVNDDGATNVDDLVELILAWGPCPVPFNDTCAGAPVVFGGTLPLGGTGECTPISTMFCNVGTSNEGGDFLCEPGVANDVWFNYTATCDGELVIDTIGSTFDTVLEIYPTFLCPADSPITCDNDSAPDGLRSVITLLVNAGEQFKIRVGGSPLGGAEGVGQLNICCSFIPPPVPENDACADAELLAPAVGATVSVAQQTISASLDPEAFPCPEGFETQAPGVWYRVVGTGRNFTASLCSDSTDFDTRLHVYCAPCEDLLCIGGDDDGCGVPGGPDQITWCTAPLQEYLILVEGFAGQTGNFELAVSQSTGTCAEVDPCLEEVVLLNDDCIDAIPITNGINPFSTLQATTDGPDHPECEVEGDGGSTVNDIWFTYTATCDNDTGLLRVSTCGDLGGSSDYDTDLVVYDPSLVKGPICENLEAALAACNEDDPINPCGGSPAFQSTVLVPVVNGNEYLIRVGGFGNDADRGTGELLVECLPETDDFCQFATEVMPTDSLQIDTCAATVDAFAPICGLTSPENPGRWLKVIGTGQEIRVDLCNLNDPNFPDTRLMVYCGPCTKLQCVDTEPNDNNLECPATETLTWCSELGREYLILVHGQGVPGCGLIDVTLVEGLPCEDPPCQPFACSPESVLENETCYVDGDTDDFNSGCNGPSNNFGPVVDIDETICGEISTFFDPLFENPDGSMGGEVRDTDWYTFTPTVTGTYSWTGVAEYPIHVLVGQLSGAADAPECPVIPGTAVGIFGLGDLEPQTVEYEMTAGTNYLLFVSVQPIPLGGPDVPCDGIISNTYEVILTGPAP
ncbi:MAG: hypothetical protein ACYTGC_05270 [Planctomycetota bacterium]|jgi:hypothetical protein